LQAGELTPQDIYSFALGDDSGLGILVRFEQFARERFSNAWCEVLYKDAHRCGVSIERETETESEFGVVFE
jgi:hypothetical protein